MTSYISHWPPFHSMELLFRTVISVLSKNGKGKKMVENEGCTKRKDGLLIEWVELDSILSWCLLSPSLVMETKLSPEVVSCTFLIFYTSNRTVVSDLQKQPSFRIAAEVSMQDQVLCLILCISLPGPCCSDRPRRRTASPPLCFGKADECFWSSWITRWTPQEKPQGN